MSTSSRAHLDNPEEIAPAIGLKTLIFKVDVGCLKIALVICRGLCNAFPAYEDHEMNYRNYLYCILAFALSACATVATETDASDNAFIDELPESVQAAAAPFQDLSRVRINPTDGCYIYQHAGPVETTFLPLRTVSGRPICTRAPEAAETS